jgi:hypothetical protein
MNFTSNVTEPFTAGCGNWVECEVSLSSYAGLLGLRHRQNQHTVSSGICQGPLDGCSSEISL